MNPTFSNSTMRAIPWKAIYVLLFLGQSTFLFASLPSAGRSKMKIDYDEGVSKTLQQIVKRIEQQENLAVFNYFPSTLSSLIMEYLRRVPIMFTTNESAEFMAFSPDGKALAVTSNNYINLYTINEDQATLSKQLKTKDYSELEYDSHFPDTTMIGFSGDGSKLIEVVAYYSPVAVVWNAKTLKHEKNIILSNCYGRIKGLVCSPDASKIEGCGEYDDEEDDGKLTVYVRALSPDFNYALTVNKDAGTLKKENKTCAKINLRPSPGNKKFGFSPDSKKAFIAYAHGIVDQYSTDVSAVGDTIAPEKTMTIPQLKNITFIPYSWLLVGKNADNGITRVNLKTGRTTTAQGTINYKGFFRSSKTRVAIVDGTQVQLVPYHSESAVERALRRLRIITTYEPKTAQADEQEKQDPSKKHKMLEDPAGHIDKKSRTETVSSSTDT